MLLKIVFLLIVFVISMPVAFATHKVPTRFLQAQVAASANKIKSDVAKQIEKLKQAYYKEREANQLDWESGAPEPEAVQVNIDIVNKYLNSLKGLVSVTKKDQKAYKRAFEELTKEAKNLSEALVQSENEDLHDENRTAYDMEEDCWGDPETCHAKIKKFKEVLALWQAFQAKVANLGHKRLAREAGHEASQIQERIEDIKNNLANAQRERDQQHKGSTSASAASGFAQLTNTPGFNDIVKNLYVANTPVACASVSFDDCGEVMTQLARSGGDLTPFANIIVQAAQQMGKNITAEQVIEEFRQAAQQQASVYRAFHRRAGTIRKPR